MRKLIMGIVDFRERLLPQYAQRFRELSHGQSPDTLFITCSDSRVVPDLLVSTDPGELFVMRNVGNLVPPATVEGASTGDLSEASAIEFATLVLKVTNIVICGHSECGAVFRLDHEGPLDAGLSRHDQLAQLNVLVQLEHLASYPIVRRQIAAGKLQLSGWWFDIARGNMLVYQREKRMFEIIDRSTAEALLSRLAPE